MNNTETEQTSSPAPSEPPGIARAQQDRQRMIVALAILAIGLLIGFALYYFTGGDIFKGLG